MNDDSLGLEWKVFNSYEDGHFICTLAENGLSWTFVDKKGKSVAM